MLVWFEEDFFSVRLVVMVRERIGEAGSSILHLDRPNEIIKKKDSANVDVDARCPLDIVVIVVHCFAFAVGLRSFTLSAGARFGYHRLIVAKIFWRTSIAIVELK